MAHKVKTRLNVAEVDDPCFGLLVPCCTGTFDERNDVFAKVEFVDCVFDIYTDMSGVIVICASVGLWGS